MYDLLLKNGIIVDGTGKSKYKGDVAIKDGKIAYVGENKNIKAKEEIDCTGKYISPGFIDAHSHGDLVLGNYKDELSRISQGITTHIGGQCGASVVPIRMEYLDVYKNTFSDLVKGIDEDTVKSFEDTKNYIEYVENNRTINLNCKLLVGHLTVRVAAMGVENRYATNDELEQMKNMVRNAMENGAIGLSTGLIYTPGVYSSTEEVVELCKVVKEYGGIYATHLRNESYDVLESVKEAIYIAKQADVPLLVSHHKIMGKDNWGLSKETLALIDDEISNGLDIILDQYPYEAAMTQLNICIPPQYLSEGNTGLVSKLKDKKLREEIKKEMINPTIPYDNFYKNSGGFDGVLVSMSTVKEAVGKTISEYAKELGKDEFDTYFDLLIECNGEGGANYFANGEEDLERIILHPRTMVGTDAIPSLYEGPGHPRNYGTFTKAIRWYVKEKKLMSLEDMIYKMTLLPSLKFKLDKKGALLDGYDADIVVFDYENIKDNANYKVPNKLSSGIDYVIINGEVAYKDKELVKKGLGKILI